MPVDRVLGDVDLADLCRVRCRRSCRPVCAASRPSPASRSKPSASWSLTEARQIIAVQPERWSVRGWTFASATKTTSSTPGTLWASPETLYGLGGRSIVTGSDGGTPGLLVQLAADWGGASRARFGWRSAVPTRAAAAPRPRWSAPARSPPSRHRAHQPRPAPGWAHHDGVVRRRCVGVVGDVIGPGAAVPPAVAGPARRRLGRDTNPVAASWSRIETSCQSGWSRIRLDVLAVGAVTARAVGAALTRVGAVLSGARRRLDG